MGTESPQPVLVDDVPLHLAALKKPDFPWQRTSRLGSTTVSMRSLCAAVMERMRERSSQPALLRRHQGIAAEAIFTLLKTGAMSMQGKRSPENIQKEVLWRLDAMRRATNGILLDDDHPFAADASIVSVSTKKTRTITGKEVLKPKYFLRAETDYRDAIEFLQKDSLLKNVIEEDLPELISPTDATIVRLQRELLNLLDLPATSEEQKREQLIQSVIGYVNHRYGNLAERDEQLAMNYLTGLHDREIDPLGPDDERIVILKYLFKKAAESAAAERELRPMIMSSLIMFAIDIRGNMKMQGREFSADDILNNLYAKEWPQILQYYGTNTAPEEYELAGLAVHARLSALESLRAIVMLMESNLQR